jgi:hypothetical protein
MEFILYLILIFFAFRFLTRLFVMFTLKRSKKNPANDSEKQKPKKKKIFTKDEGEYVDFEEIDKK